MKTKKLNVRLLAFVIAMALPAILTAIKASLVKPRVISCKVILLSF